MKFCKIWRTYLTPTKEEVYVFACTPAFVCLSVCLYVWKITRNVCMDLDEMLRVDRCRDMDELINFEPDPDHSPDAGTGLLPPISYRLRHFAALPSLAYFSAIFVSICVKLARSIPMRDRNTATEPNFRKSLSKCRILSQKNSYLSISHLNSTNTAASLDRSITSVPTSDGLFYI